MCGRIMLTSPPHVLAEAFYLDLVPDLAPRFNIAPGGPLAAVLPQPDGPGRIIRLLDWGLVPPWSRNPSGGPKLINARGETITGKPAFAESFIHRRCLIPVDGFYEWQKRGKDRQPFLMRRKDKGVFALAGVWARWEYPGQRTLETCAVVTTEANSLMRPIHHRMPVILPPGDWKLWLDLDPAKADLCLALLRPAPVEDLLAYPVTPRVNRPEFDRPECAEPVWDDGPGQLNLFGGPA